MRRHCLALLALPLLARAEVPLPVSEKDFLAELPVVLSVSRLPQPIDETPAAVTIIDRDMIRLSGARNIVDLFRLVPGFQVSDSVYYGAAHPAYHGSFNEFSNRMQVLVDGRSVYSAFRLGDVGQGLQTLALEDIERIEVIRGTDSAAYGARAVLGVVNIVTLDPRETGGVLLGKRSGGNRIDDTLARVGWGNEAHAFRLTADTRSDAGLAGTHGANHQDNINFRADWQPNDHDEWQFRLGDSALSAGTGFPLPNVPGDPERAVHMDASYAELDWRRSLGPDSDLAFSYSHTSSSETNNFWYALPTPYHGVTGTTVDFGGESSNDALSVQHTLRPGDRLRIVWGVELRREEVRSVPLYNTSRLSTQFRRLFGNLEWRIAPYLVLNAGTMLEHSTLSGSESAPRLMLNWHVMPGQTIRIGASEGHRPPSLSEKSADVRYVVDGNLLQETYVARGNVRPENIRANEIGYLGDFANIGTSIDVRAFQERIYDMILPSIYILPPPWPVFSKYAKDYVNAPGFKIRGIEYQLKFKMTSDFDLLFNQSIVRTDSKDINFANAMPHYQDSLLLSYRFSSGAELSLGHYRSAAYGWQGAKLGLTSTQRTDVRLGMPFQVGSTHCESAITVQNLGEPYNDFLPTFQFRRRAFASLTVQF